MSERTLLRTGLLLLIFILPVCLDPGAQVMAQTVCQQELTQAQEAYTFGRFDEAIRLLNQCLERRNTTEEERQQAYRLVGLSYIGKDLLNEARSSVRRLLELVPDYRPDPDQDPPPFVEMIEEVREEMEQQEVRPEPPRRDEPQPTAREEKKGGMTKWILIGGGVVLAGVAAAVLLSGGGDDNGNGDGPPQPTTLDEAEPNNSSSQAQALRGNPPITVRGNAEVNDTSELGINLDLDGDGFQESFDDFEDWFRVTTTQPGIEISLSGFSSDCDLYLMDATSLNFIATSDNAGNLAESINIPSQPAGTYIIAVSIFDIDPQGAASTSYTLTVDGTISGSSQRVMAEQIQTFGGAPLTRNVRLVAHTGGDDLPLSKALTPPDHAAWTAYHDAGNRLVEYDGTETFRFRPGQGFWVQSEAPLQTNPAAATPLATDADGYAIPLHPGWNIIANPFSQAIDWAAVMEHNGISQGLWQWDGHFSQAGTFAPAQRGEAYYFMNLTNRETLDVPHPSSARSVLARHTRPRSVLTVSAYREGQPAAIAQVGFSDDAAPGFDGYDQLAPPGYFEAASLRLIRDVSSEQRMELAREFRPWGEEGQEFDLVLRAPAHAPVELRFDGLEAFRGNDVYLIDPAKALAYNLHEQPVVTLTSTEAIRHVRLVIGTEAFARSVRDAYVPEAVGLSNYPNPFNPRTQITYTVPAAAAQEPVRLEVYDVAGHRVRVLVNGVQDPGTHRVEWDGTDVSGTPVASGLYLYRLRTGGHTYVRKMILMK